MASLETYLLTLKCMRTIFTYNESGSSKIIHENSKTQEITDSRRIIETKGNNGDEPPIHDQITRQRPVRKTVLINK